MKSYPLISCDFFLMFFVGRRLSCHGDGSVRSPSTGLVWVLYQTAEDRPNPLPSDNTRNLHNTLLWTGVVLHRTCFLATNGPSSRGLTFDSFSHQRIHNRCMKLTTVPAEHRQPITCWATLPTANHPPIYPQLSRPRLPHHSYEYDTRSVSIGKWNESGFSAM